MSALDRTFWVAVALAAYVGIAAVQSGGADWTALLLLSAGPLALAWVWRNTRPAIAASNVEPAALRACRIGSAAALIWALARHGDSGEAALELAATLAAGCASIAASYGLARIAPVPGLLEPPKAARSVDAAAFTAVLWSVAFVVSAAHFLAPESSAQLEPLTLDYAATAASIGSLLVLIAACWRVRVLRQLELGIADRAEAATAIAVTAIAVAIPLAVIDVAAPDRVLPAALIVGSLGCLWTVLARDPAKVSIVMRGTVAVMLLGVPTALIVAVVVQQSAERGGVIALLGCCMSILAGLIARNVARPLGPEQSRWLLAISEASERALVPEPRAAIVETLRALKKTSKAPDAVPQLWRLDPPSMLSVDVAGYLHETEAELPEGLCALGLEEPERTLRAETLAALQVRRAEVRPLLAWFQVRSAFSATVILDEDGPLGVLLLPRGERTARMSLEEARATRGLADRISGLLAVTSALARSRQRESQAEQAAQLWERRAQQAERVLEGGGSRRQQLARRIAQPLLAAAYSAAARTTIAQLEHAAKRSVPLHLITAPGINVQAWAAVAHLASASARGPFSIIDGAMEADGDLQRWLDAKSSPLALAGSGTLFIQDAHLVPVETQAHIVSELTAQLASSAPTGANAPLLILSVQSPIGELVQQGRIHPALASLLKDDPILLPTLEQRPEDLRALILDAVGRSAGLAKGIDRRALQLLMDYAWPGNERQLNDVVERAATLSDGPLVTVQALRTAEFGAEATEPTLSRPSVESSPGRASTASVAPRRRPRAPRRQRGRS